MMGPGQYLGFTVGGRRHAIPMARVQELMFVAAIQPTEQVSRHVLGLVNLRGEAVPILDLAGLLGVTPAPVRLDHVLMFFRPSDAGPTYGVVVESVDDLVWFDQASIEAPVRESDPGGEGAVVAALGLSGATIYHLLDPTLLVSIALAGPAAMAGGIDLAELPPETRRALEARAAECAEQRAGGDSDEARFAVFALGPERFALPLESIREIAPCGAVHPVPGAPPACTGLTNHGGEPILVVDLRPLLGQGASVGATATRSEGAGGHLLLVDDGAGLLGLYADDVEQVVGLDPGQVRPYPGSQDPPLVAGQWVLESGLVSVLSASELLGHRALRMSDPRGAGDNG